jgi:dolichol kinase
MIFIAHFSFRKNIQNPRDFRGNMPQEPDHSTASVLWRGGSLIALIVAFQVAAAQFHLPREAKRRWQHAVTGHALVCVSEYLPVRWCVAALLSAAGGLWCLRNYHADVYLQHFGPLLRPHELEATALPGAFYFLLGAAIVAALFPIATARYAVECLALADPMAAWAGQSIRSPKITASASLIGCLACFGTAFGIGYFMLPGETTAMNDDDDDRPPWFILSAAGALACSIAEALPWGNDNLTIPVATALVVEVVTRLQRTSLSK